MTDAVNNRSKHAGTVAMPLCALCEDEYDIMAVLSNFMNLAPRAAQTPASLH